MRLYVNIDHVATIREARKTDEPDPVRAAVLVELAGADGITVHLREDRRHVQERDVRLLAETCRSVLNLEVAAEDGVVEVARDIAPFQVTLVPESREEVTTEGGLDLVSSHVRERVAHATRRLQEVGVRVSLFIDPSSEAVRASAELQVEAVEFHTGEYAHARDLGEREREVTRLRHAAALAVDLGLAAHAGHGLTYENVAAVAAIPELEELNIGHAIVSRAVFVGMERAVREMRVAMDRGRRGLATGTQG